MKIELESRRAETQHPVADFIAERWSPRAFSDKPLEEEKLLTLLEAARWAPSSYNEQPWRFLIATKDNDEEHERMLSCFTEFNRNWAHTAPVLMITLARTRFSRNDKPNRHAFHDVGLAMGNLLAQATSMGIYVHQMAGIQPDRIRDVYGLPDDVEPVAGVAIGYPGDLERIPENLREKESAERSRRELRDLVFIGAYGNRATFSSE